jgi:hypothetical protein
MTALLRTQEELRALARATAARHHKDMGAL